MRLSEAVNIFLHKAIMVGGIPFDVRALTPNAETLEAMREVELMEQDPSIGKSYTDVKQVMKELLARCIPLSLRLIFGKTLNAFSGVAMILTS
jgi:DNA-damage-inducible protein J